MDNMITQSRRLFSPWRGYYCVNPTYTGSISQFYDEALSCMYSDQTTTSHRTGLGDPNHASQQSLRDERDATLTEAKSQIDFVRKVIDESRADRRERYDNGHPFFTSTRKVTMSHSYIDTNPSDIRIPNSTGRYVGALIIGNVPGGWPQWPSASSPTPQSEVDYWGARAIAETIPTNSVAETSTALMELASEGAPTLTFLQGLRQLKTLPKAIASGYLGFQFGFMPTGRDVSDLLYAVTESKALIDQLKRDSGRVVRRQRSLPTSQHTGSAPYVGTLQGGQQPSWFENAFVGGTSGTVSVTDETTIKRGFSGAYTYFYPSGNSLLDRIDRFATEAEYLLGLGLDIDTIWQAAPWTWLTDWFWNVGEIIHSSQQLSQDSLVIRYAYLTKLTTGVRTYKHSPVTYKGSGASSGDIVNTYSFVRKERFRASPYGFGLDPGGFSSRQKAILAALGVGLVPWL